MAIIMRIICPHCKKKMRLNWEVGDKEIHHYTCPKCQKQFDFWPQVYFENEKKIDGMKDRNNE